MNKEYKLTMHSLYHTKQYNKLHKHLWIWLSNNPDKEKEDWFLKVFSNNDKILYETSNFNYCFACMKYDNSYLSYTSGCKHTGMCFIQWNTINNTCFYRDSIYILWFNETSPSKKSLYAYHISRLEWRKKQ